jgi:hypothetical protein
MKTPAQMRAISEANNKAIRLLGYGQVQGTPEKSRAPTASRKGSCVRKRTAKK